MVCKGRNRDRRAEAGQAAVALIAIVPALILVALTMVQFALAGHAAIAAAAAARAGARASYVGTDVDEAALAALPDSLRAGAEIHELDDRTEVDVDAPRALPFIPSIPISASALLGPADGVPGG